MIRILAINSKYVHTLLSPYYLMENSGYDDIDIVQANINMSIDKLSALALEGAPVAVAMPTYIFNRSAVIEVARVIREISPRTLIILGGPEASYEYSELLTLADCIITGEGESAFREVCDRISRGSPLDKVIAGEPMNLSEIKSPYTDKYFADTRGKIAYFEGSRGCPFSCAYCMSGESRLRFFPVDRVFAELDKFKGRDIRVLKFVDRTFNANNTVATQIMRYLLDNKDSYTFGFHFEIAGDLICDDFLELVSESPRGFFQFEIGVQSFNEDTLRSVVRRTDLDRVVRQVKRLIELGNCHVHTDLIAGLPYEDIESFKHGFNQLYSLGSDMLQLGFLKVLRGSKLKGMLDSGYVYGEYPPYEIESTPYMSREDIAELKVVENALDKYHNSGIFNRTLQYYVKDDPYSFYRELGYRMIGVAELFDRIAALYYMLVQRDSESRVRGLLTIDYMAHNSSRVLPPVLKTAFDKPLARRIRELGIDRKRYFVQKIDINPYTAENGEYLVVADYSAGVEIKYIDLTV